MVVNQIVIKVHKCAAVYRPHDWLLLAELHAFMLSASSKEVLKKFEKSFAAAAGRLVGHVFEHRHRLI